MNAILQTINILPGILQCVSLLHVFMPSAVNEPLKFDVYCSVALYDHWLIKLDVCGCIFAENS